MAEIATIARPYADALFKAAGADAAGTAVWLDELAAIASNEQLRQFADSPKASSEQVFGVITGVLKAGLSTPAQNFLRDRKSTRLNSSHSQISYGRFCL